MVNQNQIFSFKIKHQAKKNVFVERTVNDTYRFVMGLLKWLAGDTSFVVTEATLTASCCILKYLLLVQGKLTQITQLSLASHERDIGKHLIRVYTVCIKYRISYKKMIIIKTFQTLLIQEMDLSKEVRKKRQLGINELISKYCKICRCLYVTQLHNQIKSFVIHRYNYILQYLMFL